jgi:hypothetical protein
MLRHLLLSAIVALVLGGACPTDARAAPANYSVHYRQPAARTWRYHGAYDAPAARRLAHQLRSRGYAVSIRFVGRGSIAVRPPTRFGALNRVRYPTERALLLRSGGFPRLGQNFEVLAPHTGIFNCVAWSLGITDRWVWPGNSLADFDRTYGRHGYRRLRTLDYRRQPGIEKIVLFGQFKQGRALECTHAARQASDGTWTSKLGQLPLIRHLTPDALSGSSYGRPIAVFARAGR